MLIGLLEKIIFKARLAVFNPSLGFHPYCPHCDNIAGEVHPITKSGFRDEKDNSVVFPSEFKCESCGKTLAFDWEFSYDHNQILAMCTNIRKR